MVKFQVCPFWDGFDLFGMVKWPFQSVSDLQLGDEKVTLNHLGGGNYYSLLY